MSVFAAAVLTGAVATGAAAQASKQPAGGKADQPADTRSKAEERGADRDMLRQHPGGLVQSKWLIGARVHEAEGRDIGRIDELWLDPKDGRIEDVIISMGTTMGIGGRDRVVEWKDVKLAWKDQKPFVTVDANALKHATEADRDRTERGAAASPKTGEKLNGTDTGKR
jgi:sporulation protein YlmC with PRC-barrel domain